MFNNITDVKGFKCWGAHIGIKSKRRDLAIIYSESEANVAAVFTKNLVVAEPVKLSRQIVKNGKARAIVINSGNANACTGKQGQNAAIKMGETTAKELGIKANEVIVSSTGVIGRKFPTETVIKGIKENVKKLSNRKIAGSLVANAILTTDTFPKEGFISFNIGRKKVNMGAVAKGSGMIHPNMGTMLAFIVSDIAITSKMLDKALKEAVDKTFNMITVDGDTSTNDMVAVLCNGESNNREINTEGPYYEKFKNKLEKLCLHLAKLIVSDGEGATKFIEYQVINAPSEEDARKIIKTVSNSALVKTAIFGRDPNWGRIVAAAGRSGANYDPDKVDLYMGTSKLIQIAANGSDSDNNLTQLKKMLRASNIKILLDLKQGSSKATGWGTDLSYEYVRINAEYTT